VGTTNVGSRAPAYPLLLWRCVREDTLPYMAGAPDQGADQIGFPIRRSGDHISNIVLKLKVVLVFAKYSNQNLLKLQAFAHSVSQ
jgi:hypothetical protein